MGGGLRRWGGRPLRIWTGCLSHRRQASLPDAGRIRLSCPQWGRVQVKTSEGRPLGGGVFLLARG